MAKADQSWEVFVGGEFRDWTKSQMHVDEHSHKKINPSMIHDSDDDDDNEECQSDPDRFSGQPNVTLIPQHCLRAEGLHSTCTLF